MTLRGAAFALVTCLVWTAGAAAAPPGDLGSRLREGLSLSPPSSPHEQVFSAAAERLRTQAARPETVAAVAVLAGVEDWVPTASLERALRPALAEGAHPLVAAQAGFLHAHLLDQLGDHAAAEAERAALGLLSRFSVIGPFGEGRASFRVPFPPEKERAPPELARSYRGKLREVRWREAEGAVVAKTLHLDGLLRPDSQAVAYVVTFVRSDRGRPAVLRLGSPGPVQARLNGRTVFEHDVVRPAALDQDAAGVRLAAGWNRIVLKTVITEGAWRLHLRLTEPDGRPLVLEHRALPPEAAGAIRPATGTAPAPDSLDRLLERRASSARGAAAGAAWLDFARYQAWASPRDRDRRTAAKAFARAAEALERTRSAAGAPAAVEALLGAADVALDEDERRRILERALAIQGLGAGWRALVSSRLAEVARGQRREAQAIATWREALAVDPACWTAALALAEEEGDSGLPLLALSRLEAFPPAVRALPRVRRAAARLYDGAGRRHDADRELEVLARERQVDVDLLHLLSTRARARGDGATARQRLAAASALRPDLPSLAIELARLEEGGMGPEGRAAARVTLETLAARVRDEASALGALGKLLHRAGEGGAALEKLRAAQALRPQDPELKRYVDRLAAGEAADSVSHDELARKYAADARTLLPPPSRPGDGAAPSDGAIVLLDRRVVRVHRNGLSRTFAQRVVQVTTERGAEENKEFAVHYTPGREEIELRQARIYRRGPGGDLQVLEATDRSDRDLSEPWYGLYYDNRAEIVRFETLRPGDVLEIQYLVDDVGSENQLADYFGDLQYVAEISPKKLWDYTLIAPASRPIYSNVPRLPQLERKVTSEGDERIYRFAARDVAKIEGEPAMPGLGEIAPYLHLSTYASWDEVAAWYARLIEEQLAPDDDLRRTARGLLRRSMNEEQKVRAAYDFVVSSTRYVGLEFGIHGYKPYKVTQVLARRFGDCKDKAALLIALLREMGVEAEMVLVRTRRGGRLEPSPASLAAFDHAVVYVPKLDRYLDGTAEFAGSMELPTQDQGVMVLRVGRRGGVLTETPVAPSRESRVERSWHIALDPSGDARVDEQLTIRGQAAPNWRQHYQTAGERKERYGRAWNGRFPGAQLASVEMPAIENRNQPVRITAAVAVPRFARPKPGGTLELPVSARDADFVRTYARLSARRHDLVLAYPWQHEEELVYRLPRGWRMADEGRARIRTVEGPFGRFHLEVKVDGEALRVRSFLDVARVRVTPGDYPRFRAFLAEIDTALEQPIMIAPSRGGA